MHSIFKKISNDKIKIKMLVYGQPGIGKTSLIPGLPTPAVVDVENGLLSISDSGVRVCPVRSWADFEESLRWLDSIEAREFETFAVDSLTEIGELLLSSEKQKTKDPRAAYYVVQDRILGVCRYLRDLTSHHVFMTAGAQTQADEIGKILVCPAATGAKLAPQLPYHFNEVFALRTVGQARELLTSNDGTWQAKDRSGKLPPLISLPTPDIGPIFRAILGDQS